MEDSRETTMPEKKLTDLMRESQGDVATFRSSIVDAAIDMSLGFLYDVAEALDDISLSPTPESEGKMVAEGEGNPHFAMHQAYFNCLFAEYFVQALDGETDREVAREVWNGKERYHNLLERLGERASLLPAIIPVMQTRATSFRDGTLRDLRRATREAQTALSHVAQGDPSYEDANQRHGMYVKLTDNITNLGIFMRLDVLSAMASR